DLGIAAVNDPELVTPGSEARILGTEAGRRIERRAAQQSQRAIGTDREARDAGDGGVDREQDVAVVRDFDPAWRGLLVREWRAINGVECAITRHVVGRDGSVARAIVRIGNKELAGVGGAKLTPERAGALRGKGRTGCGTEVAV